MNNQGVVNADRISQLPEALILEILCLLPTKLAISTSVLSKQWQSHWKMMPKLNFSYLLHRLKLEDICKSLLSHKAPVLKSFHLRVRIDGCNSAVDIGILIGTAFTRNVLEFVLHVYTGSFTIPRRLYNCETLETLKLMHNVVMDVPSSVNLKSLRTLHLYWTDFKDDIPVVNLLSGCPNLEDFMVCRNAHSSVKTFTIAVPSLQRLSIDNGHVGQENCGYVINAPSLKYLEIRGFDSIESCVIENVPELVEAKIIDVSGTLVNEKLMVSFTSVKRLSLNLSPYRFNFPIGSIFHQLVYLEFYTYRDALWNLQLTLMLDSSPKLQVLKLIDPFGSDNFVASREWNQPKNVSECLSFHLEIFMWKGYKWRVEDEREMVKYILKNTNRLKRATFSLIGISPEERLEVEKDLKSVVRASSSCQFQFK